MFAARQLYDAPRYANTILMAWLISARRDKHGIVSAIYRVHAANMDYPPIRRP